jgi:hypothetical protein
MEGADTTDEKIQNSGGQRQKIDRDLHGYCTRVRRLHVGYQQGSGAGSCLKSRKNLAYWRRRNQRQGNSRLSYVAGNADARC